VICFISVGPNSGPNVQNEKRTSSETSFPIIRYPLAPAAKPNTLAINYSSAKNTPQSHQETHESLIYNLKRQRSMLPMDHEVLTLSKFSGCFMSLARLGTTACPPNPARTNPIPPKKFAFRHCGKILVSAGCKIEPGAESLPKPSIRMMTMRMKVEIVDKMEGSERRRRGMRVVGTILFSQLLA
jgi:hypothetical protein